MEKEESFKSLDNEQINTDDCHNQMNNSMEFNEEIILD